MKLVPNIALLRAACLPRHRAFVQYRVADPRHEISGAAVKAGASGKKPVEVGSRWAARPEVKAYYLALLAQKLPEQAAQTDQASQQAAARTEAHEAQLERVAAMSLDEALGIAATIARDVKAQDRDRLKAVSIVVDHHHELLKAGQGQALGMQFNTLVLASAPPEAVEGMRYFLGAALRGETPPKGKS